MPQTIHEPNGIIYVTGPTGSGKTSTLYSILSELNNPDVNIVTVEDPVEYQMSGVGQVQVKEKIGMTFAAALRSILLRTKRCASAILIEDASKNGSTPISIKRVIVAGALLV